MRSFRVDRLVTTEIEKQGRSSYLCDLGLTLDLWFGFSKGRFTRGLCKSLVEAACTSSYFIYRSKGT